MGQSPRKLPGMTSSSDVRSHAALAAPGSAAVQAALDRLCAGNGVPLAAVECAVGDFTSVARGKSVGAQDFVGLAGCRFPSLFHPLFDIEAIERATQDRYFLVFEQRDDAVPSLRDMLPALQPFAVHEVAR